MSRLIFSARARHAAPLPRLSRAYVAPTFSLTKAAAPANAMAGGQFVTHKSNDARHDLMKKILYDLPPRTLPQMSEGDRERHQAIMRAYKIHKQEQEELKRQERERKFACIQRAREELRLADPRLFKAASRMESNLTFPRQMRAPVETPPSPAWKY